MRTPPDLRDWTQHILAFGEFILFIGGIVVAFHTALYDQSSTTLTIGGLALAFIMLLISKICELTGDVIEEGWY